MSVNVAIFINSIGDLNKVGGVERFFPYFFAQYCAQSNPVNNLYIFTYSPDEIMQFEFVKPYSSRVIGLKTVSNRFKDRIEAFDLWRKVRKYNIDILHITNYYASNFGMLRNYQQLPLGRKARIVINIVNCELPYAIDDPSNEYCAGYRKIYQPLFENIKISGVYAWNEHFKTIFSQPGRIKSEPLIEAISSRFADYSRFVPGKKRNEIIFASRMDERKKPLWFLSAIDKLNRETPSLLQGWNFLIYGRGPLEGKIKQTIEDAGLTEIVRYGFNSDLSKVFNHTRCFVSLQEYDNFPSLAMNEAMSSGNAIIARNVGQTNLFVKDGYNGLLLKEDNENGLLEVLRNYLSHPEVHESMQENSVRLTQELHTPANFIRQIDRFWNNVMQWK